MSAIERSRVLQEIEEERYWAHPRRLSWSTRPCAWCLYHCTSLITNKLFRSLSYHLSAGAHIRQLSHRRQLDFGESINDFARRLVVQYLDFPDTTPLENALSDCEALSQAAAALCRDIWQTAIGESEELSKARELQRHIRDDLVVLKDTWHFLVQGRTVLRKAFNDHSLLCLR